MELVSIIVPIYNVEKYLERCIQSIVEQTYTNLEIILVNDGSKDNSLYICEKWKKKDSRIIVIDKNNGGLSSARNAGIEIAKGEYLFFVDSDDWLDIHIIQKLYQVIKEYRCEISCCGIEMTFDQTNKNYPRCQNKNILFEKYTALEEYMFGTTISTVAWNKLYKRALFEDIRYPIGKWHEDEFTTYKLLYKADRVYYLGESMYFYYQREGSIMSHALSLKNLDKVDALFERYMFFQEKGEVRLSELTVAQIIDNIIYYYCLNDKRGSESKEILKKLKMSFRKIEPEIKKSKYISGNKKIKAFIFKMCPMLLKRIANYRIGK